MTPRRTRIVARFRSACAACSRAIVPGMRAAWADGHGIVCRHCYRNGREPAVEPPAPRRRVHAVVVVARELPAWAETPIVFRPRRRSP